MAPLKGPANTPVGEITFNEAQTRRQVAARTTVHVCFIDGSTKSYADVVDVAERVEGLNIEQESELEGSFTDGHKTRRTTTAFIRADQLRWHAVVRLS